MSRNYLTQIKLHLESVDEFNGFCKISSDKSMNITYTNSSNTYESNLLFIFHNNKLMLHMESIHKIGDMSNNNKIYNMGAVNIDIPNDDVILQIYMLFKLHSVYKMEQLNDNISVNDVPKLRDLYEQSMNILKNDK